MAERIRTYGWPVIAGLLMAALYLQATRTGSLDEPVPLFRQGNAAAPVGSGPVSYSEGTEKAAPAVVNIYTTRVVRQRVHPLLRDPMFRQFFGYQEMPGQERMDNSLGSGVIATSDGLILTNHHVIAGADEIRVALRDGREAQAQLVGSDPETDVAVLRIDLPDLPVIRMRNSELLKVGDVVLAIGNPFGVGQTVTMGIVSATGRKGLRINAFENFIQTDAAINPGNSGGALVDAYGQLIGINTAIFSKSGGSMGIGFAIPANLAREVMDEILLHGRVIRGWLGIEIQELSRGLAESFGLDHTNGIVIAGIFRNGPAHRAGIKPGDLILKINGKSITGGRQAMDLIAQIKPGQIAQLKILRDGRLLDLPAEVGTRDLERMQPRR